MDIVGISGSLRQRSYNSALLRTAVGLAPAGMAIEIVPIGDLPLFNEDLETGTLPQPVTRLRERVGRAAGLLIACPENNSSPSAALKNAIDWLSRGYPGQPNILSRKPVAAFGATPGMSGTIRAQVMLRTSLTNLGARMLPPPEVWVGQCSDKFNEALEFTDERGKQALSKLLAAFAGWVANPGA